MEIIILRIKYPNDSTNTLVAHQHFIGELTRTSINIYSVSSIFGKEDRVFGADADDYEKIDSTEITANGFKVPSFIDCTKMYQILLDDSVDLSKASSRNITCELAERIRFRIERKKLEGRHTIYTIDTADIKIWNPRIVKPFTINSSAT